MDATAMASPTPPATDIVAGATTARHVIAVMAVMVSVGLPGQSMFHRVPQFTAVTLVGSRGSTSATETIQGNYE